MRTQNVPAGVGLDPALPWSCGRGLELPAAARQANLSSGRAALRWLVEGRWGRGARVLAPVYLCDSLLAALTAAGAEVGFYQVDESLGVDWRDLSQQAARCRPQLLLLIHYFGRLQDAEGLAAFRGAFPRVAVVEDLSHSLLNAPGRQGHAGLADYGLASLRKLLPVPDGALVLDYRGKGLPPAPPPAASPTRFAQARLDGDLERAEALLDAEAPVVSAHPLTLELLPRLPAAALRRRRRANWLALAASLRDVPGIRPLQSALCVGQAPLGFPVRCANRHDLQARLLAGGVLTTVHWPLPPPAARAASRGARLLAGTLLTLPVDPRCGAEEMRALAEMVREAARGR